MKPFMLHYIFFTLPKDLLVSYYFLYIYIYISDDEYCKICILISVLGISLFKLVMYLSAPIAFIKAGISLLHGYVSCINLSIIDLKERQERLKVN